MANATPIDTVTAIILIATVIAIGILVVHLINRPSRRTLSSRQSSAVCTDPAPTNTAAAASTSTSTGRPSQAPTAPARLPYTRIPYLLTPAEGDFFGALQAAAPAGMLIFAQVRLAGLVHVQPWARRDKSHWWRIQAKCVDFVLVDSATFAPLLVIELDDSSHNRADRRERDAFVDAVLAGAGIPILHIRWQRRYDPRDLAQQIAIKLPNGQPTSTSRVLLPVPASTIANVPRARSVPPSLTSIPHACGHCHTDIRTGAKFCPSCGAIFAGSFVVN